MRDLTIIDESTVDDGWVKVTCNAGEGYVSTDYVTISTDFTVAESKNAEIARLAKEERENKINGLKEKIYIYEIGLFCFCE